MGDAGFNTALETTWGAYAPGSRAAHRAFRLVTGCGVWRSAREGYVPAVLRRPLAGALEHPTLETIGPMVRRERSHGPECESPLSFVRWGRGYFGVQASHSRRGCPGSGHAPAGTCGRRFQRGSHRYCPGRPTSAARLCSASYRLGGASAHRVWLPSRVRRKSLVLSSVDLAARRSRLRLGRLPLR